MNELEIFERASEIDDADERDAFLAKACGEDRSLRQRLDALLQFQEEDSSFLNEPIADLTEDWQVASGEDVGDTIGRYKLLDRIGEGGFGVVYMAEQREPVQRRVALKVIKLGMDTRQVIGRFEAERQALAMMDHSNIAQVFDGGATETGRPYFVMELVKGIPITEFCDNNQLSVPQRLRLFADVCSAVQHAHQKGIIHRDLKPSNVLVGMHDDLPVPKVIDFGVAKAMQQRLTERTVFTRFKQIIGTPAYMSPEQAGFSDLDVDTRSDIYSLGVLLYELLTGTTPLAQTSLRQAGYDEICRIVREEEATLPSLFVSRSRNGQAQKRGCDSKALRRTLEGDLDWIVMKTLEKNRLRRYDTASALRQDINNYLHDLPVSAGPPSATYRLSKFVKRNRLLVSTSALISVLLVVGVVGLVVGYSILTRQKKELNDALNRAQANFELAGRVVHDFLTEVSRSEELLAGIPGTQQLRRNLLTMAKDYNKQLVSQTENSKEYETLAASYSDLAITEEELGNYPETRKHLETAIGLRKTHLAQDAYNQLELAKLLVRLGSVHERTASYAEAEKTLTEAQQIFAGLLRQDTKDPHLWQAAIDARTLLGLVYKRLENHQASIREFNAAIDLANSPDEVNYIGLADTYQFLGLEYRATGQLTDSIDAFLQAIEICEDQDGSRFVLASCINNLGITYIATEEFDKAADRFERAILLIEDLIRTNPLVDKYRLQLAHSHRNMGIVRNAEQDFGEAEKHFQRAVELLRELADENPTVAEYQINLVHNCIDMGLIEHRKGNNDLALRHLRQSFDINKELDVLDPRVAHGFTNIVGTVTSLFDDSSDAVRLCLELIDFLDQFAEFDHRYTVPLADAHGKLSEYYLSKGDMIRFEKHTSEAIRHAKLLVEAFPGVMGHRLNLVLTSNNLGKLLRGKGELQRSEEVYLAAIQAAQGFDAPDAPVDAHVRLGDSLTGLGAVYREMGKIDEALGRFRESVALAELAVNKSPNSDFRVDLARNRLALADCIALKGSYDEALRLIAKSEQELNAIPDEFPDQGRVEKYLRNCSIIKAGIFNDRAWQCATNPDDAKRDGAQAVRDAQEACELSDWSHAPYLDTLAAAHAELGEFEDAIKHQEKAIDLAPGVSVFQDRLEMYKRRMPFRSAQSADE